MNSKYVIILALSLIMGTSAYGSCAKVTRAELPLLPKFCQVKCELGDSRTNPQVERWAELFGWKNYIHMHHYCAALVLERRVLAASDKRQRDYELQRAVHNYDYVLKHWQPGFVLIPEAHVRKGLLLEKLGNGAQAAREYEAAIHANPKYPAGYAALSAWYKQHGSKSDAIATLEKGLKEIPKSRILRRRLDRMK